ETMRHMRIGTLRRAGDHAAGARQWAEASPGPRPPRQSDTAARRPHTHTTHLTRRRRPGDVAVTDHVDIDRVSADALVGCKVAAVVNASPSISGRYPNLGPDILISAGIPLLDDVGRDVFTAVKEGAQVRVEGNQLLDE